MHAEAVNGTFMVRVPIPQNATAGPSTLHVSTQPGRPILPASTNVTVVVQRVIELSLELPRVAEPGALVQGRIHALDDEGEPVSGERMLLETSYGASYYVTTDAHGQAEIVVRQGGGNETAYTVRFAGNEGYGVASASAAVSSQAPSSPGGPPGILVLVAITLLAAAALATLVHRQRGAARADAIEALERGWDDLLQGTPYRVTILETYYALIRMLEGRDVEAREEETLREYQARIERLLGLRGRALDDLFGIFEDVFYSDVEPGPTKRDHAVSAFRATTEQLRSVGEPDAGGQRGGATS